MLQLSNQLKPKSIANYLDLEQCIWYVELEVADFKAIIAELLELPQNIYELKPNEFFWAFLKHFLEQPSIGFILRPNPPRVDLALLGYWQNKRFAIPLWIIRDLLLGFEVISSEFFSILDSEPIRWSSFKKLDSISQDDRVELIQEENLLYGKKIFLKIEKSKISVTESPKAFEFLFRIAQTDLLDQEEIVEN